MPLNTDNGQDIKAAQNLPPVATDPPKGTKSVLLLSGFVVGLYLVWAGGNIVVAFCALSHEDHRAWQVPAGRWWAMAFGAGAVAIALLITHVLGRDSKLGIFRPIVGGDHRFSTSLTQLGLWTIAAGTGFAVLLGRAMFDGQALTTVLPNSTWDDYLILLGGPFAGAVLVKGIVTYKLDAGTLQKSEPAKVTPKQVVTNDSGAADLVDSQYLLFNVIALGYFVVELIGKGVLPSIPAVLLAMTSATAALYTANKAAQRNAPTITSISPPTAQAGDVVTILGTNFEPATDASEKRRVGVALSGFTESIYPTYPTDGTDTRVRFEVPAAAAPGHQTVTVISTAGYQTEARDLEIRSAAVLVTGLADGALRPGSAVTLTGRNLGLDKDAVRVTVGTIPVAATPNTQGTELAFIAPNPLADPVAETVELKVAVPGLDEMTITVPVERPRIQSAWRTGPQTIQVVVASWHDRTKPHGTPPQLLANGRPCTVANPLPAQGTLTARLPTDIDGSRGLQLTVVDDLGRRSDVYLLTPDPA